MHAILTSAIRMNQLSKRPSVPTCSENWCPTATAWRHFFFFIGHTMCCWNYFWHMKLRWQVKHPCRKATMPLLVREHVTSGKSHLIHVQSHTHFTNWILRTRNEWLTDYPRNGRESLRFKVRCRLHQWLVSIGMHTQMRQWKILLGVEGGECPKNINILVSFRLSFVLGLVLFAPHFFTETPVTLQFSLTTKRVQTEQKGILREHKISANTLSPRTAAAITEAEHTSGHRWPHRSISAEKWTLCLDSTWPICEGALTNSIYYIPESMAYKHDAHGSRTT